MRRILQFLTVLLPTLLLSQDVQIKPLPFITIDTVEVSTIIIPETDNISFMVTEDIKSHVEDFLKVMEDNNVDLRELKNYDGIYTVNYMKPYADNDNIMGLTFKAFPKDNVKGMTILKVGHALKKGVTRTLVYHELSHALTRNELPHCRDYVNCSAIFYEHIKGMEGRLEKYWEMELEQLVNMIKIYQKYDTE